MVRAKEYIKEILCIEGYWSEDIKSKESVRGALTLLEDNIEVKTYYHKCITRKEVVAAADRFSTHQECGLYYFAFHGSPNVFYMGGNTTSLETLSNELEGKLINKIVHFGCCETLQVNKRHLQRFLQKTGALVISGYTKQVDFLESTLLDILYFQICQNWKDVRKIEEIMSSEHRALIKKLGFRMVYIP